MNSSASDKYRRLGDRAIECLRASANKRVVIAIAGIPGSGKSTIAKAVSEYVNSCATPLRGLQCVVVGIDGFHLTRQELMEMPDPEYAFARRGAPFTFDAQGAVNFVKRLRESCVLTEEPSTLSAPAFDHKLKDPVEDEIIIAPNANIILLEGLYVLLDEPPWNCIGELVDERWFIETDWEIARERVAKRHLEAGIEASLPAAYRRADENDALNAKIVSSHRHPSIDFIVE